MAMQKNHSSQEKESMASDEQKLLLPGSGQTARRSAATMVTGDMVTGGAGEEKRGPDGPLDNGILPTGGAGEEKRGLDGPLDNGMLATPWGMLISAASSCIDNGHHQHRRHHHHDGPMVRRKPRSHVTRAAPGPSHQRGFKVSARPPATANKKLAKKVSPAPAPPRQRHQRVHHALSLGMERPAWLCVLCDAKETLKWRTLPTGQVGMVCNACWIRVKAPGSLQEQVHSHSPPPATATMVVSEQGPLLPQEEMQIQAVPDSESPPDSPILEPFLDTDVYMLKRNSPRREEAHLPPPRWCLHCGSTSTPQWRSGPKGCTLCNACGVRYLKGRLAPEYRPAKSPDFDPSRHAYKHRDVLKLRKGKEKQQPLHPTPAPQRRRLNKQKGKAQLQEQEQDPQLPVALQLVCYKGKGKAQQEQEQDPQLPVALQLVCYKGKGKGKAQHGRPPQPSLKIGKVRKVKAQRLPPQPAAMQPRTGEDMAQHPPPPPPPAQAHAGDDAMEQNQLPPPAQPQGGDDLMMDEPVALLLDLNEPAAPMIVDDDEKAVEVIVID